MTTTRLIAAACAMLAAIQAAGQETESSEAETLELETLTVEGQADAGFFGPSIAQTAGTVLKTGTPILETPRSLDVVTQQQLQDRGVRTVGQALQYSAGVIGNPFGMDNRSDWSLIRGFDPSTFHDGLQARYGYYNDTKPETFLLDSVSVLKGPAGVLFGAGSVGGIVNTTSKLPDPDAPNIVQFQAGTNSLFQTNIDYNGAFDPEGKVTYRLTGLARNADGAIDFTGDDSTAFMPSITWRPGPDTQVTLLGLYQKTESSAMIQFLSTYGTLFPGPDGQFMKPETFIGEPSFDYYNTEQTAATAFFDHRFDATWAVAGSLRYADGSSDYHYSWWAYDNFDNNRYNPDGTINRDVHAGKGGVHSWVGDLHATADFTLGGVQNATLFGVSFTDGDYDEDYGYGSQRGPIDPFDPVYTGINWPVPIENFPVMSVKQRSGYVQNRATFRGNIFLDLGLRYDRIDSVQATYNPADPTASISDNELSTSAALLYAAPNGFSPYVSYSEVFAQEEIGSDAQGNPFEPIEGVQYEAGVKYQPPGTSAIFTAAVFDITKSNLAVTDPENPLFSKQIGEATSRGLELEAQAVWRDISVDGAYTYLDTEDTSGERLPNVPKHFASLWLGYRPQGPLFGWKGGFGVRYLGETVNTGITTPDNTLYDAMIGYETDRYDITLTGSNLADKTYLTACDPYSCYFGETRTILLSVTAKF